MNEASIKRQIGRSIDEGEKSPLLGRPYDQLTQASSSFSGMAEFAQGYRSENAASEAGSLQAIETRWVSAMPGRECLDRNLNPPFGPVPVLFF